MTRIMQDSVNTNNFTAGADIYAGYVLSDTGHGYNNFASMAARFPDKRHLAVCTRFNSSQFPISDVCLDYEGGTTGTGSGNAQQAVNWTVDQRAAGRSPWNYCNQSTWPELRAAYTANEVAEPIWWIANTNTGPVMIPGAHAHQYTFNLPRNPYDTSIVADFIPGFDDGHDPSGGGNQILLGDDMEYVIDDPAGGSWHTFPGGKEALTPAILNQLLADGVKHVGANPANASDLTNFLAALPTAGHPTPGEQQIIGLLGELLAKPVGGGGSPSTTFNFTGTATPEA